MKFLQKYTPWILLGLLIGFGLIMWGVELAKAPGFEFYNKREVVCFKIKEPVCYKLITIK